MPSIITHLVGSAKKKDLNGVGVGKKLNNKPRMMTFEDEPSDFQSKIPLPVLISTYLAVLAVKCIGHTRDYFAKFFNLNHFAHLTMQNGMPPLIEIFESFFARRLYHRIRDCWNRPTTLVPSRIIHVLERETHDNNETFQLTGRALPLINMASYNYLGFAQGEGPCADAVKKCLRDQPVAISAPRSRGGTLPIHHELEELVADFLGVEDSMILSMGFATNSLVIPAIASKGTLVLSDELNHTSIRTGCSLTGVTIQKFKHNDMLDLERLLRESIVQGQPRTHRPWKNIWVIVEGLYSMEGNIVRLPKLLELKEYYKFYLYVDEAHSIGALGPKGRGVCDFWGVDARKVDILMGTFTKSFGAAGGYLAGTKKLISHLRKHSIAYNHTEPMQPPICTQVITSLRIIKGDQCPGEGQKRLIAIRENSIYFMRELKKMGFLVLGDEGSPIVPVLILNPAKISAFSREAMVRGVATVVVGFPATDIHESRVRFCISASHTREDLDKVLQITSEIGDVLRMKYAKQLIF